MNLVSSVYGSAGSTADYGLLNAQRRKPEQEQSAGQAGPQLLDQPQPQPAQTSPARLAREPDPELTSPSRAEVPAMLQGVVSQISASSKWKLADVQPVSSKAKLVTPAYV